MPEGRRGFEAANAELREGLPIADQDIGKNQRHLLLIVERLDLVERQFTSEVRNDSMPAGQHGMSGRNSLERAILHIGDRH